MHTIQGILLSLALAAPVAAQASSPTGYLNKEGESQSFWLGFPRDIQSMYMDSGFRGTVLPIKEIAWRYKSTAPIAARSWSNVTIHYAPCKASTQVSEFSKVPLSTPTLVFSGTMSWPAFTSGPSPTPWGGSTGALRAPFNQTVMADGLDDISFHFRMRGSSSTGDFALVDAAAAFDRSTNPRTVFGTSCPDTAFAPALANTLLFCNTYIANHPNPLKRDMLDLEVSSDSTAPNSIVAHVLAAAAVPAGVPLPGLACAKLYVDLSQPAAILFAPTDGRGIGYTSAPLPYRTAYAGLDVWAQSAWTDSATGQLKLTKAERRVVAQQPRPATRYAFHNTDLNADRGMLPTTFAARDNPLFRYGR